MEHKQSYNRNRERGKVNYYLSCLHIESERFKLFIETWILFAMNANFLSHSIYLISNILLVKKLTITYCSRLVQNCKHDVILLQWMDFFLLFNYLIIYFSKKKPFENFFNKN